MAGNQLTIQAPAGASGSFPIQVTVSDGHLTATQTFTAAIRVSATPQIAAIASQSLFSDRSQNITLSATDAQNNPVTFSAKILGTFAWPRIAGGKRQYPDRLHLA